MKKIIASAVGLMLVGSVAVTTASAVESQFGGYWRARAFFQDNFNQPDGAYNRTDQRTQLFYTAKFNDDFKFVNKFEINSNWGDGDGGQIGADATDIFRIKNSYADFTLGMVNTKIGIQPLVISRGFIFDADFSGAVVTGDFGTVKVPVAYISGPQDDVNTGVNNDTHILTVMPQITINDNLSVTPHATWATVTKEDTDIYYLGVDVDAKYDAFSAWGTAIYNGGTLDQGVGVHDKDINAWLVAAGAEVNIVHGRAFYASGDDGSDATETNAFQDINPGGDGQSYYWSEIMGLGTFDNTASNNSPGDKVSNVWAANVGVTVPIEKLTLGFDVWYAQLDEEILAPNGHMEDELGLEFDGKLSYELMENLNADVVFAYLVAGDATGPEDVMEGGVKLSLKF